MFISATKMRFLRWSIEGAITMESFEKSLALLQVSHSVKCNIISSNIISNRTCHVIVQFLKFVLKILVA